MTIYERNLSDVLAFFGGKRFLSVSDVCRYTGLDRRTVERRFPIRKCRISAVTLATVMAGER